MNQFNIPKYHNLIISLELIQTKRAKKLLSIINENQPISVNRLALKMGDKDNTTISRELQYLVNLKMVKVEKQHRFRFYEVDLEGVEKLSKAIYKI